MSRETLTHYLVHAHQRDLLAEAKRERLKHEVYEELPQQVKQLPWLTSLLSFFRPTTGGRIPVASAIPPSHTHV